MQHDAHIKCWRERQRLILFGPRVGLDWELSEHTKREIAEIERNTREAHRLASSTYFD